MIGDLLKGPFSTTKRDFQLRWFLCLCDSGILPLDSTLCDGHTLLFQEGCHGIEYIALLKAWSVFGFIYTLQKDMDVKWNYTNRARDARLLITTRDA